MMIEWLWAQLSHPHPHETGPTRAAHITRHDYVAPKRAGLTCGFKKTLGKVRAGENWPPTPTPRTITPCHARARPPPPRKREL